MNTRSIFFILLFLLQCTVQAQYNWPEDAKERQQLEKLYGKLYYFTMRKPNIEETKYLKDMGEIVDEDSKKKRTKVYEKTILEDVQMSAKLIDSIVSKYPDFSFKIYLWGTSAYKKLRNEIRYDDPEKAHQYEEKIITFYEQGFERFPEYKNTFMHEFASDAYDFYKNQDKIPYLLALFSEAKDASNGRIAIRNFYENYMDLVRNAYYEKMQVSDSLIISVYESNIKEVDELIERYKKLSDNTDRLSFRKRKLKLIMKNFQDKCVEIRGSEEQCTQLRSYPVE